MNKRAFLEGYVWRKTQLEKLAEEPAPPGGLLGGVVDPVLNAARRAQHTAAWYPEAAGLARLAGRTLPAAGRAMGEIISLPVAAAADTIWANRPWEQRPSQNMARAWQSSVFGNYGQSLRENSGGRGVNPYAQRHLREIREGWGRGGLDALKAVGQAANIPATTYAGVDALQNVWAQAYHDAARPPSSPWQQHEEGMQAGPASADAPNWGRPSAEVSSRLGGAGLNAYSSPPADGLFSRGWGPQTAPPPPAHPVSPTAEISATPTPEFQPQKRPGEVISTNK